MGVEETGRRQLELSWHLTGGTEENQKVLRASRPLGPDFNPRPPKYEAGVTTIGPRLW
jgi:hypothetical protein